jgi:hypothetical protein
MSCLIVILGAKIMDACGRADSHRTAIITGQSAAQVPEKWSFIKGSLLCLQLDSLGIELKVKNRTQNYDHSRPGSDSE